jgi:hypothetical protein
MRRLGVGLVLSYCILAACQTGADRVADGGGADAGSTPDSVRLACGEKTRVFTSSVVRQAYGVHFQLSNAAGAEALFVRDPVNPQDSWMRGALADVKSAEFTLPIPPGEVLLACLHPPVNTLELPEEYFEPLTILAASQVPND